MCQELWIDRKPVHFGEMVKLVGRKKVVAEFDDYGGRSRFFSRPWDCCVCGVDLKATGEAAGFVVREFDAGEYEWKRP